MLCVNGPWQPAEKYGVRLWIIYGYGHLFAPVYFKDGVSGGWKWVWNHVWTEDAISQLGILMSASQLLCFRIWVSFSAEGHRYFPGIFNLSRSMLAITTD